MIIDLHNHRSRLHPDFVKQLTEIQADFKIRANGYFWSPAFRSGQWDGYVKYISDAGYFGTGLWPKIKAYLDKKKYNYLVHDYRETNHTYKIPKELPGAIPREYQIQAARDVLENKVGDVWFPRGISNQATNAGKTIFAALLYKAFRGQVKCLFIVNRVHLYRQGLEELPKLIGEDVGGIGPGGKVKLRPFTIASVQTLTTKVAKYREVLRNYDIVIVDECHYAPSKSYQRILTALDNATIRVGMSGTPLKHRDKNRNEKVREYFGEEVTTVSNKELIDKGYSTKPIVTILDGNLDVIIPGDADGEVKSGIIRNPKRTKAILKRVKHHTTKGRTPMLVVGKFHDHVELLYKKIAKRYPDLRVEYIHVGVPNRLKILKDFKEGKVDILVSSLLIKEGANLPLIRALVYAAAGDSSIVLLQIIGRALRKHKSKKRVYIDDFMDVGAYLKRHSKRRLIELKAQGFKIIEKHTIKIR